MILFSIPFKGQRLPPRPAVYAYKPQIMADFQNFHVLVSAGFRPHDSVPVATGAFSNRQINTARAKIAEWHEFMKLEPKIRHKALELEIAHKIASTGQPRADVA